MHKAHKYMFSLLMVITIVDPGNIIFQSKELFFVLTVLTGVKNFIKFSSNWTLLGSLFFSILFPLLWIALGVTFDYNFSMDYGLMYLKSFAFFLLVNVCVDFKINYAKIFSISTLFLAPITLIIFCFLSIVGGDLAFLFENEETFVVSRRAFGNIVLDPTIYYKTSPLLIFGLSYMSHTYRLKSPAFKLLIISLCLFTLFVSGTRANIIAGALIIIYFIYSNYFSRNSVIKYTYWLIFLAMLVLYIAPFLITYAFDAGELSNRRKINYINDYINFWSNDTFALVFGQGLGGGLNSSTGEVKYMLEPTYFEIIRMFGIVGGCVFSFFLLLPIILFKLSKSSALYKKNHYVFIAYLVYLFVEIPTNPLLISSTGMIVLVVVYSTAIKTYLFEKNR